MRESGPAPYGEINLPERRPVVVAGHGDLPRFEVDLEPQRCVGAEARAQWSPASGRVGADADGAHVTASGCSVNSVIAKVPPAVR